MVAPYGQEICDQLRQYLGDSGFTVLNLVSLGLADLDIPKTDPGHIFRIARDSCRDDADAIFLSCTNFRGFEIVVPLERDLGKPVVTANQATMWHALQLIGIREKREDLGTLFAP